MSEPTFLTADQARARWGLRIFQQNAGHHVTSFVEIDDGDHSWVPVFDNWLAWIGYRIKEKMNADVFGLDARTGDDESKALGPIVPVSRCMQMYGIDGERLLVPANGAVPLGEQMKPDREYRYVRGVNGEHCIDYGTFVWSRIDTIGKAATEADAHQMCAEMNTVMAGTNAKLRS